MILAAACVGLTLLVLGLLIWPLWRGTGAVPAQEGAYDLSVYKAQLGDLDRDLEQGLIETEDAKLLQVEIQRRILRVDQSAVEKTVPIKRLWLAISAVLMTVMVFAAGFYLVLGSPTVPDQPYAARAAQIHDMQVQVGKISEMVDQLAARLQEKPDDGKGWSMLGRSLRVLRQHDRAKTAYEHALKLLPNDIQVRLEYASLLIENLPAGTPLPEDFVTVMRDVLAINPDVPDALYFVGLAEAEAGHPDKAKALWGILLKKVPPESPDRAELQKQIDSLK
jgi:cytochrome c-type biogenesis protein CcmH